MLNVMGALIFQQILTNLIFDIQWNTNDKCKLTCVWVSGYMKLF